MIDRTTRLCIFAVALAVASCASGEASVEALTDSAADTAVARIAGIAEQGNSLGDPRAPLTLTVFSDLRCSHCRDFEQDTLPVLVDRYVRAGKLLVVHQNLPILGPQSVRAARFAIAVGQQNRMFEFMDIFFQRAPGPVDDTALRRAAGAIPGLDVDEAFAFANSAAADSALATARTDANALQVRGTPSFVLARTGQPGTLLRGVRSTQPETLTSQIDAVLSNL